MKGLVAVVGAGIVGLWVARTLRERGYAVCVVERNAERRDGASFGNAGIVVPSHVVPLAAPGVVRQGLRWMLDPASPFFVKPRPSLELVTWGMRFARSATEAHVRRSAPALLALNLASRRRYEAFADEVGRARVAYADRGLLMLCRTEAALAHEAAWTASGRDLGLDVRVLDRAGIAALEPGVDVDALGAVYVADDVHLDPAAVMRVLQDDLAADDGAELRFDTEVVDVDAAGGRVRRVLLAPSGRDGAGSELAVDGVVLAAGTWSATLGRRLGLRLAIQPGKGYSVTMQAPTPPLRSAAILVEARASATSYGDRFRVGGTMELAGFDERRSAPRIEAIRRAARAYFPSLDPGEVERGAVWSGFRPVSADGLPYVGAVPGVAGAFVATGHAMMGFSAAPATADAIAALVDGAPPAIDLEPFRPDRHGRRAG